MSDNRNAETAETITVNRAVLDAILKANPHVAAYAADRGLGVAWDRDGRLVTPDEVRADFDRRVARREHVHDVSCAFGNPTCPAFGEAVKADPRSSWWARLRMRLSPGASS